MKKNSVGKLIWVTVPMLLCSILGYWLGVISCKAPCDQQSYSSDWHQIRPHDGAIRDVIRYGHWAGYNMHAVELHNKSINEKTGIMPPLPETVQFPAGWTLSLNELRKKFPNCDKARAYLAIKDSTKLIMGMPEIELIFVGMNAAGGDIQDTAYVNLIRPCPNLCNTTSIFYEAYSKGLLSGRQKAEEEEPGLMQDSLLESTEVDVH